MRTKSHPFTDIFRFSRHIQSPPASTGSRNQNGSGKPFPSGYRHHLAFPVQPDPLYLPVFQKIDRVTLHVLAQIVR